MSTNWAGASNPKRIPRAARPGGWYRSFRPVRAFPGRTGTDYICGLDDLSSWPPSRGLCRFGSVAAARGKMRLQFRAAAGVETLCRGPVGAPLMAVAGFGADVEAGGGPESIRENS